jgi:hypothetical protein
MSTESPQKDKNSQNKKWELVSGVQKGLEDLNTENPNNPEIKSAIEQAEKIMEMKNKISKQEENLRLRMLISSRERNVYLEKLRKIEEFCEEKNWDDQEHLMKEIYDILYNDAN